MTPTIIRHTRRKQGSQIFVVISYSVRPLELCSAGQSVFQHYESFINGTTYLIKSEPFSTEEAAIKAFEGYVAKYDALEARNG